MSERSIFPQQADESGASNAKLFQPVRVGALELRNRVVMAPLTRCRAEPITDAPHALNALYYRQRASMGLIISEGTQVTPQGMGYSSTPGIYSAAQVEGWRLVTDGVHAEGGLIVAQLWHVGRISHPDLQPNGLLPVAPSAIAAKGTAMTASGPKDMVVPRALETDEISGVVKQFRDSAENARLAGFDGVEIHGANGYLLDQFMHDSTNKRTDQYGGSIENRARLTLEIVDACCEVFGADRVGIRLSPVSSANDIGQDSNPQAMFGYVVDQLSARGIAFIHMVEGNTQRERDVAGFDFKDARQRFTGTYMANNGYDRQMAIDAVEEGSADVISFGRLALANPDLVRRLKLDAPLQEANRDTFYAGGEKGYTDYPTLQESMRATPAAGIPLGAPDIS